MRTIVTVLACNLRHAVPNLLPELSKGPAATLGIANQTIY